MPANSARPQNTVVIPAESCAHLNALLKIGFGLVFQHETTIGAQEMRKLFAKRTHLKVALQLLRLE